jgi:hypothetical protein
VPHLGPGSGGLNQPGHVLQGPSLQHLAEVPVQWVLRRLLTAALRGGALKGHGADRLGRVGADLSGVLLGLVVRVALLGASYPVRIVTAAVLARGLVGYHSSSVGATGRRPTWLFTDTTVSCN